jgi:cytochrome c biogenesis protein CcmG/thiol:disulfide interchange protein DsbE
MPSDTPPSARDRRRFAAVVATIATAFVLAGVSFAVTEAVKAGPSTSDISTPPASSTLKLGSAAPLGFRLHSLDNRGTVSLAAVLDGRPGVINFFASWCTACQAELSSFAALSSSDRADVAFIGIDTNDPSPSVALRLADAAAVHYPLTADPKGDEVATAYGINGLPVTFIVDRDGRVRDEIEGRASESVLRAALRPLLVPTGR